MTEVEAKPADLLHNVAKGARRYVWAFVGVSGMINLLALALPLYILHVFDRVLSSESLDTLAFLTLAACIAVAAHAALDGLRTFVFTRIADWWATKVAPHTLERSIERRLSDQNMRIEMLREVALLKNFIGGNGVPSLLDLPWLPLFIFVSFLIHPSIGFIAVGGMVGLFLLALMNEYNTRADITANSRVSAEELRYGESIIRNAEVIDSMGMTKPLLSRWQRLLQRELGLNGRISRRVTSTLALSRFFRAIVQVALYGVAASLVIANQITPGAMIAGSIIAARILAPIESMLLHWRGMLQARDSYQRVLKVFETPALRTSTSELPVPRGQLMVDGISYSLPGRAIPILRSVRLNIEPGDHVGVIGPAAAGKTTFVRTLMGILKPTVGRVRLDGADVYSWNRADFGRHVGYLPQGVELFQGTVAENIARFTDADDADIIAAARLAGCHELILSLERGYETEILENGAPLSGGQRQRIALARAVFGGPKLVVLDEPNSNLDMRGDQALQLCLRRLRRMGTTAIVVTHRQAIIGEMTKVLVLEAGQVSTFGPRQDVLDELKRAAVKPPAKQPCKDKVTPVPPSAGRKKAPKTTANPFKRSGGSPKPPAE